jgi:predicted 2-oxoglutarate/Fe(II)-dependent dioxygenase YbiX
VITQVSPHPCAQDTVWFDGNNVGVTDRRQRLVTVLVQMSRAGVDYGGGSLQYQSSTADGVWVNAPGDEGAAVLFPSHLTPHRVRTVAWGRRNVLVWWIWGKFEKNA